MQDFEPPVAKSRNHLQILLSLYGGWGLFAENRAIFKVNFAYQEQYGVSYDDIS